MTGYWTRAAGMPGGCSKHYIVRVYIIRSTGLQTQDVRTQVRVDSPGLDDGAGMVVTGLVVPCRRRLGLYSWPSAGQYKLLRRQRCHM